MIPSAYYESVGRKHAHKVPLNPYFWDQKTIVHILENRQYTGLRRQLQIDNGQLQGSQEGV